MVKRSDEIKENLANLFAPTASVVPVEDAGSKELAGDPVSPLGVGVRKSEGTRLSEIARQLGINRHALLVWVVRDFIRRYEAGERPETETKQVLKT